MLQRRRFHIELAGGLIGNLVDESVREWFARLRAWSFLFCIVWVSWIGVALLCPSLIDYLLSAAHKHLGASAVLGWIGTTIASVLAGKGPRTSGTSGDNSSSLSRWLNICALVGPSVFVVGLALLLSDVMGISPQPLASAQRMRCQSTQPFMEALADITSCHRFWISCLFHKIARSSQSGCAKLLVEWTSTDGPGATLPSRHTKKTMLTIPSPRSIHHCLLPTWWTPWDRSLSGSH